MPARVPSTTTFLLFWFSFHRSFVVCLSFFQTFHGLDLLFFFVAVLGKAQDVRKKQIKFHTFDSLCAGAIPQGREMILTFHTCVGGGLHGSYLSFHVTDQREAPVRNKKFCLGYNHVP